MKLAVFALLLGVGFYGNVLAQDEPQTPSVDEQISILQNGIPVLQNSSNNDLVNGPSKYTV